jgi:hypothetical protein
MRMMRPFPRFLFIAVLAALVSCKVTGAVSAAIGNAEDNVRNVKWTKPKYWKQYKRLFRLKRLKKCAKKNGIPPKSGSSCPTKNTGWYTCMFGYQECKAKKGKLPGLGVYDGVSLANKHPKTRCDCMKGQWNCYDWKVCRADSRSAAGGVSKCPIQDPTDPLSSAVCSKTLECTYGKESCCDQTFDSLVCFCKPGEKFRCVHTDACILAGEDGCNGY